MENLFFCMDVYNVGGKKGEQENMILRVVWGRLVLPLTVLTTKGTNDTKHDQ